MYFCTRQCDHNGAFKLELVIKSHLLVQRALVIIAGADGSCGSAYAGNQEICVCTIKADPTLSSASWDLRTKAASMLQMILNVDC